MWRIRQHERVHAVLQMAVRLAADRGQKSNLFFQLIDQMQRRALHFIKVIA